MPRAAVFVATAVVALWGAAPVGAQWTVYEESTIEGPLRGVIAAGTLLRTASGTAYEVVRRVDQTVELQDPYVVVHRSGDAYRMQVEGIRRPFRVRRIGGGPVPEAGEVREQVVVDSRLDGEFHGFDYGNQYRLENGQIWEQTEYTSRYRFRFNPRVVVIERPTGYLMQVEGIADWIAVRRLR